MHGPPRPEPALGIHTVCVLLDVAVWRTRGIGRVRQHARLRRGLARRMDLPRRCERSPLAVEGG
jgi:hypothetical protein